MALDFFAGCVGGCAGVLVGHPFDTIKVRLQTQDPFKPVYKGSANCIYKILKHESGSAFFKGMSSPLASLSLINAVVFGTYGNIQKYSDKPQSIRTQVIGGCVAGFVQSFICSPMELVKIRMQLHGEANIYNYKNPWEGVRTIWRTEGKFGIFKGLWCTILRDMPAFGVYFSSYEILLKVLSDDNGNISTPNLFLAGGLAGTLSWVIVYPLDVMKTRLQVDNLNTKTYSGLVDCIKKSYRAEGLPVFGRGLGSTLLRAFPTNAATLSVVTWIYQTADRRKVEKKDKVESHVKIHVPDVPDITKLMVHHADLYL